MCLPARSQLVLVGFVVVLYRYFVVQALWPRANCNPFSAVHTMSRPVPHVSAAISQLCDLPADDFALHAHASDIAEKLLSSGYAITPNFLSASELEMLAADGEAYWQAGEFREARVGQGERASLQRKIRRDRVLWLDAATASEPQRAYMDKLEIVREAVNRASFAGLFDWEGHLAVYPVGAFYRPHLDCFENSSTRILSTVLYLNTDWAPSDGGELRLWLDAAPDDSHAPIGRTLDIPPLGGTLVTFWSDQYVHEVLPANFERMSITGWFRRREG